MQVDYTKIKLIPLFEPIKKLLEFYILAIRFVGEKEFQKIILNVHPEFEFFLNSYNKEVKLSNENGKIKSSNKLYWTNLGRSMAITIFDILECSEYHNYIKKEDVFKFAKHIRNGAAHNNKFYFKNDLKKEIIWRDKKIANSLKGKEVFPSYMNPILLIFLMKDISDIIEKKSKKDIKKA